MEKLHYSVASAADSAEIIHLLAKVFSHSEPPAVAVGLSSADMEQFLKIIVPDILAQELTIIARHEEGRLAGALLTEDFADLPALDHSAISGRFAPILAMLENLERQYFAGRIARQGEYLHLLMLGVEPRFAGCGVATNLVATCVENGAGLGYRTAMTEATGKVSQHVFRKHGFVDRATIPYREFRCGGTTPFASILEHKGAILMDKILRCGVGP